MILIIISRGDTTLGPDEGRVVISMVEARRWLFGEAWEAAELVRASDPSIQINVVEIGRNGSVEDAKKFFDKNPDCTWILPKEWG